MRLDVHQHLWTEPLVAALARRRMPPRVRRQRDGWWLDLAGEAPSRLELTAEDVGRRAALVHLDGLDRALVALSAPLGIEALDLEEAVPAPAPPPARSPSCLMNSAAGPRCRCATTTPRSPSSSAASTRDSRACACPRARSAHRATS